MRVYISSKLPLSITILDRGQVPFRGRNNNRPFSLHPASPQDTARVNQQKTAIFFFNTLASSGFKWLQGDFMAIFRKAIFWKANIDG